MNPLIFIAVVGLGVTAMVGVVAVLMREKGPAPEERLAAYTGQRTAGPSAEHAEIWRKAAFESDKKNLLDHVTPNLPSLQKLFEQADCHIRPSTLFGIAVILGCVGASISSLAGVPLF